MRKYNPESDSDFFPLALLVLLGTAGVVTLATSKWITVTFNMNLSCCEYKNTITVESRDYAPTPPALLVQVTA